MELVKAPQIYEFTSTLSILAYFLLQKRMEMVSVRWSVDKTEIKYFKKIFFNLKRKLQMLEKCEHVENRRGLITEHGFWPIR